MVKKIAWLILNFKVIKPKVNFCLTGYAKMRVKMFLLASKRVIYVIT